MTCRILWLPIALLLTGAASADAQNCKKGKPCGNTCIARTKTCHVGQGTATWAPGVTDTTSSVKASGSVSETAGSSTLASRTPCRISAITDGDTVRCAQFEKGVRLLLIDAPERDQGPYGVAAARALEEMLPVGSFVDLEFDIEQTDRYGRKLGYLWLADGTLVNEELARAGYVLSLTYPPNVKYIDRIRAAVEDAKAAKRGLWSGSAFECTPKDHRADKC